jgi:hypothetical protein
MYQESANLKNTKFNFVPYPDPSIYQDMENKFKKANPKETGTDPYDYILLTNF